MFKQIYSRIASVFCDKKMEPCGRKIHLMFHSIENKNSANESIYHMPVTRFREVCKFLDGIRTDVRNDCGDSIDIIFTLKSILSQIK